MRKTRSTAAPMMNLAARQRRLARILRLRTEGHTLDDIAREHGISRQRVHQIIRGSKTLCERRGRRPKRRRATLAARLGSRLRAARMRQGRTLAEVAPAAGISIFALTRLESGARPVSLRRLAKVLRAIDVEPGFVWPDGTADGTAQLAKQMRWDTNEAKLFRRRRLRRAKKCG